MTRQRNAHDQPLSPAPRPDLDAAQHHPAALPRRAARAVRSGLAAAQARFRRARPGSVLILVVALLVLIALAGTALITTTRTDRYATAQNTANTQVEMLIDAVVRLSKAQLVDDLFGGGQYRPATPIAAHTWTTPTPVGTYENYDEARNDTWLASRVPSLTNPAAAPNNNNNPPYWLYISSPMVNGLPFESPQLNATAGSIAVYPPSFRRRAVPTFIRSSGEWYPALRIYDNANQPYGTFLAGDADGDGIADAGLSRIPVGQLSGVTYYAAVRIVDNSAAFNANVHWKKNPLASSTTTTPAGDLFPVNVDYQGALFDASPYTPAHQMHRLNIYRTGGTVSDALVTPGTPTSADPGVVPVTTPLNDTGTGGARNDFEWISHFDQWHHQLGRRLDNPGFYEPGRKFRTLGGEDATAIAYRFVLRNPNSLVLSPLEQMLLPSLESPIDPYRTAGANARTSRTRTQPYGAPNTNGQSSVAMWFHENFDQMGRYRSDRVWSRRSVTVTRNPTANAAPMQDMQVLAAAPYTQVIGTTDDQMTRRDQQSFTPRTSINSAKFGELWRSYWMAMSARGTTYDGNNDTVPDFAAPIFRDPIRRPDPSTRASVTISPRDTLLLRAACAAVNAIDYRDSDTYNGSDLNQNVTSKRIHVMATVNGAPDTPVEITVFGNEPQPFITEVYANSDSKKRIHPRNPTLAPDPVTNPVAEYHNPKGYVAVELYNPTNVTINLNQWHLGIVRRRVGGTPAYTDGMLVMPITGFTGFGTDDSNKLLPGQRMVLENYNNGDPQDNAAMVRPKAAGTPANAKYVRNLHEVFKDGTTQPDSGELVLLRPRRGDGLPTNQPGASGGTDWQEFNGGGPTAPGSINLDELVPLDSVDFTGFELAAESATEFFEMHYVRGNKGVTEDRWKCVYPGRWTETSTAFRHEGMVKQGFAPPPGDLITGDTAWAVGNAAPTDSGGEKIALSREDDSSSYTNTYPGIQLNNKDLAGPNPVKTSANRFPFGGFARNGDILGVPFIGAYTIRTEANASTPRGIGGTGRARLVEINPITHDSARARDNWTDTDGFTDKLSGANDQERITFDDDAFEMIGRLCPLATTSPSRFYQGPGPRTPVPPYANNVRDPYGWAQRLFDYLGVENPHDDFLPNVARDNYGTYNANGGPFQRINPDPDEVDQQVNPAPIEGRININTAPAKVLASLPFWSANNDAIAEMIVKWRDGDPVAGTTPRGPFYSLYDLNRVFDVDDTTYAKRFQAAGNAIPTVDNPDFQSTEPATIGDYSPLGASDDVTNDYEARYLMLNRISNLVSTRSDSYTVYIVVQGWRGVNTANPTLVAQRRAAYIADRSGITDSVRDFTPVIVPTN